MAGVANHERGVVVAAALVGTDGVDTEHGGVGVVAAELALINV